MEDRENNLKFVVSSLTSLGISPPIFSQDFPELDSILESFSQCIGQMQKDQRSKQSLSENIQNFQMLLKESSQKIENFESQVQELESELSRVQNLINTNNLKFKQEREKITQERENAKKEAAKMGSLCTQYLHDSKKNEAAYNKLQEHLRKCIGEKEIQVKNCLETTSALKNLGCNPEKIKGDEEFLLFIKSGYQNSIKYYTEIIGLLIKTVNDCFNSMKSVMDGLNIESNWSQLSLENPEKFGLEIESRLKNFEKSMKNVEIVKEDEEFSKNSIPYLKKVLQNYKDLIESNILMLLRE